MNLMKLQLWIGGKLLLASGASIRFVVDLLMAGQVAFTFVSMATFGAAEIPLFRMFQNVSSSTSAELFLRKRRAQIWLDLICCKFSNVGEGVRRRSYFPEVISMCKTK